MVPDFGKFLGEEDNVEIALKLSKLVFLRMHDIEFFEMAAY
jgi:hypothetical protein